LFSSATGWTKIQTAVERTTGETTGDVELPLAIAKDMVFVPGQQASEVSVQHDEIGSGVASAESSVPRRDVPLADLDGVVKDTTCASFKIQGQIFIEERTSRASGGLDVPLSLHEPEAAIRRKTAMQLESPL